MNMHIILVILVELQTKLAEDHDLLPSGRDELEVCLVRKLAREQDQEFLRGRFPHSQLLTKMLGRDPVDPKNN
jgi:hypothetical protein